MAALIVVRDVSGPLASLAKKLDRQLERSAGKGPRPAGVYFLMDGGSPGLDQRIRAMVGKEQLKHVHFCLGGPPEDYEINRDADVTAVVYQVGKKRNEPVTANFAFRLAELDETKADAIVKALAAALPK